VVETCYSLKRHSLHGPTGALGSIGQQPVRECEVFHTQDKKKGHSPLPVHAYGRKGKIMAVVNNINVNEGNL
jgi:hypothetical protein